MADITVKRFDEMESALGGLFVRARAELGVRAFGLQVIDLPAGFEGYPEHTHQDSSSDATSHGQEEVYVPLEGDGTLIAGDERFELSPGMAVRVGPAQTRKIVPANGRLRLLAIGGVRGKPYEAVPFSELDAGETSGKPSAS